MGSFHSNAIGTVAGESRVIVVDATYTVDLNGHGTMTWLSPQRGRQAPRFLHR
jgi:Ni,Fe-hydrogenase maturation factor